MKWAARSGESGFGGFAAAEKAARHHRVVGDHLVFGGQGRRRRRLGVAVGLGGGVEVIDRRCLPGVVIVPAARSDAEHHQGAGCQLHRTASWFHSAVLLVFPDTPASHSQPPAGRVELLARVVGAPQRESAAVGHTHGREPMCRFSHMATNLALDPDLLNRAFAVGGERTKKDTVTHALVEYIARREQGRLAELFGALDWDDSYDYKAERGAEPCCSSTRRSGPSRSLATTLPTHRRSHTSTRNWSPVMPSPRPASSSWSGCRASGDRATDSPARAVRADRFVDPERRDHIRAAEVRNDCRRRGIQLGTIDALLVALCLRHELRCSPRTPISTTPRRSSRSASGHRDRCHAQPSTTAPRR